MKREPHPCDDLPVGTWVWWCHHRRALEQLTEPGRNRVDYIYAEKPENEQAVRLAAFRRVIDQAWAAEAWNTYDEARAEAMKPLAVKLDEEYPGVPYSRETGKLIFRETK